MRLVIDRVSRVYRGGAQAPAGFSLDLGPGVLADDAWHVLARVDQQPRHEPGQRP